jgi:2-methylcitrate dehydratase PrpD
VIALRRKIGVTTDDSLAMDQAEATIIARGAEHRVFIEHATGTADNPMKDGELEAKFMANAEPVIGRDRADEVRSLVWDLDRLSDVRKLIQLCA